MKPLNLPRLLLMFTLVLQSATAQMVHLPYQTSQCGTRWVSHRPVLKLLYGVPFGAAGRLDAYLHFFGPIRSQFEELRSPSEHTRLLRTC